LGAQVQPAAETKQGHEDRAGTEGEAQEEKQAQAVRARHGHPCPPPTGRPPAQPVVGSSVGLRAWLSWSLPPTMVPRGAEARVSLSPIFRTESVQAKNFCTASSHGTTLAVARSTRGSCGVRRPKAPASAP